MEKILFIAIPVIIILQAIGSGIFAALIAQKMYRDNLGWFCLGFLFGIVALVALIGLGKADEEK